MKTINVSRILVPFFEVGAKVISFLVIILLTRIISTEDYGVYSFSIAIASWFTIFADMGVGWFTFNNAVKRETSVLNLSINSRLFQSLFVLLVVPFFFIGSSNSILITFLVTFFFLNTGFVKFLQNIFRGFEQSKNDIILVSSEPIARLILMVILYAFNIEISLLGICIGFSIIGLVLTIIFLVINLKKLNFKIFIPPFKKHIALLGKTKQYFFYQFFQIGIGRMDIFFLEKHLDFKDVAYFSSAYNLYSAVTLFFLAFITANLKSLFNKLKLKYFLFFLISNLILVTVYFKYLRGIYTIIYPIDYKPGALVLAIMALALPFYAGYQLKLFYNNYRNRTLQTVIAFGIVFCLKIVIYFVLTARSLYFAAIVFSSFEIITFLLIFGIHKFKWNNESTAG
ncbi:oligosaccharide flippase family protein [Jejuia spongiicola]|uniref:Oligosaccharide flippase family protein n=1 Tax=Jejuia spongiicola TaxID=2942207 RepID=A0ABT0Q956_9FLAO|nr:oligosaccharide flippase family protein [Jejuia spongiicola]MCL6293421.1 oligosaccharide flippase family protein [Jejuia spongiicola]